MKRLKHLFEIYDHDIVWYGVGCPKAAISGFSHHIANKLWEYGIDGVVKWSFIFSPDKITVKWDGDAKISLYEVGNYLFLNVNGHRSWVKWEY